MKRTSFIFGILLLCLAVPVIAAEKVTICHASGHDDTTHFVTLEINENAVYGNGGHFDENGTPQAGHELDHFGPCADEADDTTTTAPEATTTTQASQESTTTTAPEVTTTTQASEESTTTTTAPEQVTTTTTAPEVTTTTQASEESTTTTTAPEQVTTTTTAPEVTTTTQASEESTTTTTEGGLTIPLQTPVFEEDSVVAGFTVTQAGQAVTATQQAVTATQQAAAPAAVAVSIITGLPFTGLNTGVLALIAVALALVGTFFHKSASIEVSPRGGGAHSVRHPN